MLRRATSGSYPSRAEIKARDERKDTLLLITGAALIVGFVAISFQLTEVAIGTAVLFGIAALKTIVFL
jgi:hypothetical protein